MSAAWPVAFKPSFVPDAQPPVFFDWQAGSRQLMARVPVPAG
jgi:hypothetical protein